MNLSAPDIAVTLRPAASDDLPALVALEEHGGPGRWDYTAFAAELRTSWSHMVVLESCPGPGESAEILGFMVYWCVADETQLLNITVHPQYRRRGWGRTMLAELLRRAAALQHQRVMLEVRRSNEAAQRLYSTYNFQPVGVRRGYYADNNEDAILMELRICQP